MVNIIKLFTSTNKKDLINNLQKSNLIPTPENYKCPNCENFLNLCEYPTAPDGYVWRCRAMVSKNKEKAKKCETMISIRTGTFFEQSKMAIPQV